MVEIFKKNIEFKISEHLSHKEFRCQCINPFCMHTLIDSKIGPIFETLRAGCGNKAIIITSAYRCSERNFSATGGNGSPVSMHLVGKALDMIPPIGIKLDEFKELALIAGFTFAYANENLGYVHADIRHSKE